MRRGTAVLLRCPRCHAEGSLALEGGEDEGELRCARCRHGAAVREGIAHLLYDPPAYVLREAAGLARFADVMRADGWDRERVLRLPDEPSPYWHGQRMSYDQLRATVAFRPGQRLLDVGSNTCWASAAFARDGLEVLALDIAAHELQGLGTARWWMDRDGTYFERLLAPMYDLPLASATLDHVFCCEVLHHNGPVNLFRTLREAHRVLRPGGKLSVIRETLRSPLTPQLRPGREVAEYEGHEHAFLAVTYLSLARAAGFHTQVLDPAGHWVLGGLPFAEDPGRRRRARAKLALLEAARRRPRSRRAYRAVLHHLLGTVPLSFIAVKEA